MDLGNISGLVTDVILSSCINIFIRCLAHVINLAMQALLSTYSSAGHFDPNVQQDYDLDDIFNDAERDEVGLVRAITVKVSCKYQISIYYQLSD